MNARCHSARAVPFEAATHSCANRLLLAVVVLLALGCVTPASPTRAPPEQTTRAEEAPPPTQPPPEASTTRPRGTVQVTIESSMSDRAKLEAFVLPRRLGFHGCYEKELARDATLEGTVVVAFVVTASGRAEQIDVTSRSPWPDSFATCVKLIPRGWVLPFTPEAPQVRIALTFTRQT